jgi:hypothetical protein
MKYNGKYITTEVPRKPDDEFKIGNFVCLGYENPKEKARDAWLFKFHVYKHNEKVTEYLVRPEIVDTRRFYLKEDIGKKLITRASFETQPNYEHAREKVMAFIRSR